MTTDLMPTITAIDGIPTVSSLHIAEHFGKQHKDVLRAIQSLELPSDFGQRNFTPSSYVNEQNKMQPMYNITRDGFTLLVMGFTGKKAMEWKVRYIEAFNQMEAELKRQAEPPSQLVPTTGNLPAVQLLQLLQRQHDETGKLIELGLTAYATATEAKATADTALNEIRELKAERDQVREALDQLPLPIVEAPTETGRMKLLKVVANIAKLSGREFQLVWNAIYDDFRIRCHIDLKARSRHDIRKRKPLDIAEDEGLIERLYAIAHEHLTRIQRIQEVA